MSLLECTRMNMIDEGPTCLVGQGIGFGHRSLIAQVQGWTPLQTKHICSNGEHAADHMVTHLLSVCFPCVQGLLNLLLRVSCRLVMPFIQGQRTPSFPGLNIKHHPEPCRTSPLHSGKDSQANNSHVSVIPIAPHKAAEKKTP